MREAWVVVKNTKCGKQYLAHEAPNRIWNGRLGMAKLFFQKEDAKRETSGRYHAEKVSI